MEPVDLDKVQIRLAKEDDLSAIINLLADDALGKTREIAIIDQEIPTSYLNAYSKIKDDPKHMLVVMDYNSEIVGTLQLIIIPTLTLQGCIRAEVEGVRVKANYRRFSLGKILFRWVKETAIANGCGLIQLTTNKNRSDALCFYESLGYAHSHCGMKMLLKGRG